MNHSRYSLPSRLCGLLAAVSLVGIGGWSVAVGQVNGPELTPAGNAAPPQPGTLPAAAAAAGPRPALPNPQQLLLGSCRMLSRQKSIVAKVRHRATIYDRELIGSGEYAQGPELARLLRYELRMQVDDRVVNLLQVADGRHLWISKLVQEEPEIQRIDIDRVLAHVAAEDAAAPPLDPYRQLGLGGLSQLMAAIARDFEFNKVFRSELGGLKIIGIEGAWKAEALEVLVPKVKKKGETDKPGTDSMRPHVPDRVVLFLGADDLFPYRFEFRRSVAAKATRAGDDEASFAVDRPSKPLLVLEFFDVHFDVPIEERQFHFSPSSYRVADITDKFLAARKVVP